MPPFNSLVFFLNAVRHSYLFWASLYNFDTAGIIYTYILCQMTRNEIGFFSSSRNYYADIGMKTKQ